MLAAADKMKIPGITKSPAWRSGSEFVSRAGRLRTWHRSLESACGSDIRRLACAAPWNAVARRRMWHGGLYRIDWRAMRSTGAAWYRSERGAARGCPLFVRACVADVSKADAMALPFKNHRFDAAVMALVIFFVPDPAKGVSETGSSGSSGWIGCSLRMGPARRGLPL